MSDNNFRFFERTLGERRTYRGYGGMSPEVYAWMRKWGADEWADGGVPDSAPGGLTLVGTHQMRPGNPLGVARVNERFNVTLPTDFDDFYRRWNGGTLLFRDLYPLLSVEEMLDVNELYREWNKWDRRKPYRLIRFCALYNTDFLALRLAEDESWQVVHKGMDYPDREYFDHWHEHPGALLDESFTAWLHRMVATDGWPLGGKWIRDDDEPPPMRRVGA